MQLPATSRGKDDAVGFREFLVELVSPLIGPLLCRIAISGMFLRFLRGGSSARRSKADLLFAFADAIPRRKALTPRQEGRLRRQY